jgi:glycine/D-amino acid oxidase-like deaminating enzyme
MIAEPSPTELEVTNFLWSANWRALALSRITLRTLLSALRAGTVIEASEEVTVRMVEIQTAKYARAVRDHMGAALGLGGSFRRPGFGFLSIDDRFGDELQETGDLMKLIRDERPDLAQLTASEQVSAVLTRNASVGGHTFDWAVAHCVAPAGRPPA